MNKHTAGHGTTTTTTTMHTPEEEPKLEHHRHLENRSYSTDVDGLIKTPLLPGDRKKKPAGLSDQTVAGALGLDNKCRDYCEAHQREHVAKGGDTVDIIMIMVRVEMPSWP